MANNSNLKKAAQAKKDEFYTQLEDIENELKHYKVHFKGKTVLCNCDDPYESNFFKYFAMNFNYLGLKKLIATCYVTSPVMYTQLSLFDDMEYQIQAPKNPNKKPYKVEITEVTDENGDGAFDLDDIKYLLKSKKNVCKILKGDGDFRSEECIELLKEADIVVTNPPFSLFREYIAQLMEYDKKFLIIGNINAVTYRDVFPLIMNNKVWWGVSTNGSNRYFRVPDTYPLTEKTGKIENGIKYAFVNGVMWYTNLDIEKLHEELILYKTYSPEEYPRYDNYDAIEVSKVTDIPCDYYGVMGVPITFLNKYNPSQFEIIGMDGQECSPPTKIYSHKEKVVNGERMRSQTGTMGCVVKEENFGKGTYFDVGYPVKAFYKRIFIRRKEQPT